MTRIKIQLSDVYKNHLKVIGFLVVSAVLGYVSTMLADKPELVVLVAPIINYILFAIKQELDRDGIIQALKDK
jgi:hypothetical protein